MLTVTFTQQDLDALSALLDAAVKATGIQGAKVALPILAKLERAVADVNGAKDQEALTTVENK
jgi:hypothetical protein